MSIDPGQINFLAVLVAAVAMFTIGGVWYGLLFAKRWAEVHGYTDEQLQAMAKTQRRNFAIFFVSDLVMGVILSLLIINLDIQSAIQGAGLGLVIWFGIAATIGACKNAANNKPLAAFVIDTGHELTALVVMGMILGAWR
ncbi:MAG: DUF1761 domain-containing protein [Planctomycetes bacterium]|nr:DUF1761 domain-containing protein [Planctomycetota bacterium]